MAKRPPTVAEQVATTDVMPRATDKEVRAAKKKAEAAARVTTMVNDQIATKPARKPRTKKESEVLATTSGPVTVLPDNTLAVVTQDTEPAPDVRVIEKPAYQGPMLALRERLKAGRYAKMANGQPACGDGLARILGELQPVEVIAACIEALDLPGNPYTHLNIGQQSMNLRNKLRTALKKGMFGMGVVTEAVETQLEARVPRETK